VIGFLPSGPPRRLHFEETFHEFAAAALSAALALASFAAAAADYPAPKQGTWVLAKADQVTLNSVVDGVAEHRAKAAREGEVLT
jgi:hypothetical protein